MLVDTKVNNSEAKKILELREMLGSEEIEEIENIKAGETVKMFEDPSEMFDFIIDNSKLKVIFIDEIRGIIRIMDEILYTPSYKIWLGRISIEKPRPNIEPIKELFYEGS